MRKILFLVFAWVLLTPLNAHALQLRSANVRVPEDCLLDVSPGIVIPFRNKKGEFKIYFLKGKFFPVKITLIDPNGVTKTYEYKDPSELINLTIPAGIIKAKPANPKDIDVMPELCPRVTFERDITRNKLIYDARKDVLNNKPRMHLVDNDIRYSAAQRDILNHFDDKNILTVERIKLEYDYEDDQILDYFGPHPITKAPGHKVYEGQGGFYANLHYAVVPYEARFLHLDRQELLNLAEGKLYYSEREDLLPKMRVHSFLPGPYLSKKNVYAMCEWGDTAYQTKTQTLDYIDLRIWDWDLADADGKPFDKVLLIVWEGDEEDWMIANGLLDPLYLTDDIVGVFEIERGKTLEMLTLKNEKKDFEIRVKTVL